jgi:hypothetical protein
LLGFPEWRVPRYCQAILSQVRGEQGVVALDEGYAMYLISTVRAQPTSFSTDPRCWLYGRGTQPAWVKQHLALGETLAELKYPL